MKNAKVTLSSRVDLKMVAAIAIFLDENGAKPKTRSDMLQSIVELCHEILLANGKIEPIPSFSDAMHVLSAMGFEWEHGSRPHKQIAKGIITKDVEEMRILQGLRTVVRNEDDLKNLEAEIAAKLQAKQ